MTNPKHTDTSRSGDPVAWMYEYGGGTVACTVTQYEPAVLKALGYTETPLYPADRIEALEAECRNANDCACLALLRIKDFEAENKWLLSILEQWLNTAREHLDTEVAGRTFEALRKSSHD